MQQLKPGVMSKKLQVKRSIIVYIMQYVLGPLQGWQWMKWVDSFRKMIYESIFVIYYALQF